MQSSVPAILQAANLYVYVMNSPIMWIDPSGLNGNLVVNGREISNTIHHNGAMYGSVHDFAQVVGGNIFRISDRWSGATLGYRIAIGHSSFDLFLDGRASNISYRWIDDPNNPGQMTPLANLQSLVNASGSSITSLGFNLGTSGGTHIQGRNYTHFVSELQAWAMITVNMVNIEKHVTGNLAGRFILGGIGGAWMDFMNSAQEAGALFFTTQARAGIWGTDLFSSNARLMGYVEPHLGQNIFFLPSSNLGVFRYGQFPGFYFK